MNGLIVKQQSGQSNTNLWTNESKGDVLDWICRMKEKLNELKRMINETGGDGSHYKI